MYVCLCNGFRDCELKALGARGVRCPETAYAMLGGQPKCGSCLETAQNVLSSSCGTDNDGVTDKAA
jgi:bacterioferritin-associated ferredoxin